MQSLREKMATSIEGYIFSWDIFEEGYYILWYYSQLDPNIETSTLYFRLNISYALLGHLTWFNKIENKIIYRSWKQRKKGLNWYMSKLQMSDLKRLRLNIIYFWHIKASYWMDKSSIWKDFSLSFLHHNLW